MSLNFFFKSVALSVDAGDTLCCYMDSISYCEADTTLANDLGDWSDPWI